MNTETRNLLVWRLNTDNTESCWRADSLAGIKMNIILGKESSEGIVCLPGGQVFIAAIEDPSISTVDDIKDYLQKLHDTLCAIRDLSAFMAIKSTKPSKPDDDKPRIILPR